MTPYRPRSTRRSDRAPRIALAFAGGGPLGAIYEIGALCALEQSLTGLDLNRLDHYVGVSAGGFIAAGLANGISAQALCTSFIEGDPDGHAVFDPAWLMQPATDELEVLAVRAGANPGSHLVGFDAPGETLEIRLSSRDRSAYASGIVASADWLSIQPRTPGIHAFRQSPTGSWRCSRKMPSTGARTRSPTSRSTTIW